MYYLNVKRILLDFIGGFFYGIMPYFFSFLWRVFRVMPRRLAASLLFPFVDSRVFSIVAFSTSSRGRSAGTAYLDGDFSSSGSASLNDQG